ncbi:MAG TPA: hypothetical protein PLR76_03895 [Hyphomonas sp.]|nr:hypothetical protein [Hyphomonas sp.]MCA8905528.1 hypothetical protein [Hyphomonas sp.]MCB9962312.1 hypothetical protein [Hyphomonas sp.]MCB9972823.1 hypothetical protein [Hyphomonas sp.]HPE47508.1 hypothetical protein [Hyphomonas sp.]
MRILLSALALGLVAACASTAPYGPASKPGAVGYDTIQIENNRYRISYTDRDPAKAHDRALLRAAEVTLEARQEWFEITSAYVDEASAGRPAGGTSISIGGATGSHGRSSVGVGVGFGIPLGGSSAGPVTEVLEIVTGSGEKPDRPSVYDARSVDINLRSAAVS